MDLENDSEETGDETLTPEEIINQANTATENLLPAKSKEQYIKEYNTFMEWRNKQSAGSFSERVILAYFEEKSKNSKSSTLWSCFSKLKATLLIQQNVDIGKYSKLIAYLKRQSVGYRPKKSNIFSREEVYKFLLEAPDDIFLMLKVKKSK